MTNSTKTKSTEREEEVAEKAELSDLKQFIRKKQLQNQILKKITMTLKDEPNPVDQVKDSNQVA